jgi:hypothetical protein
MISIRHGLSIGSGIKNGRKNCCNGEHYWSKINLPTAVAFSGIEDPTAAKDRTR